LKACHITTPCEACKLAQMHVHPLLLIACSQRCSAFVRHVHPSLAPAAAGLRCSKALLQDDGPGWQQLDDPEICAVDAELPLAGRYCVPPETELPLDEPWSALRGHLFFARVRKLVGLSFQSPLALIPLFAGSWWLLPELSQNNVFARLERPKQDLETFASLEDVAIAALSITLGVLVGTMISVLRERQQALREEIFEEMALVQVCTQQHVKLFRRDKGRLRRSMRLLAAYLEEKRDLLQVITDNDIRFASFETLPWQLYWDRQQRRSLALLDVLAEMGDGIMAGPRYGFSLFNSLGALEKCEHTVMELNSKRAKWRASLESTFPSSLFFTVFTLMLSLVLCFLLRAGAVSSPALLSEKPVRLLFSLMVCSFGALLQIMLDLSDPFSGAYGIKLGPDAVTVAVLRVQGALQLSNTVEPFDASVDDAAIRPAMDLDDTMAVQLARNSAAEARSKRAQRRSR